MAASKCFKLVIAALAIGVPACVASDDEAGDAAGAPAPGGSSSKGGSSSSSAGSGGSGGSTPLPPEEEIESSYRAPVVTGNYVWSANPDSGRIAVIDPRTLVVRLAEAGFQPSELTALPSSGDTDRALVINSGSDDVTLLRADASGVTAELTLPVHPGANAWAVSPGGRWAIAWTDVTRLEGADPTEGFQDVTVVDLSSDDAYSIGLSVGFRPSQIVFDDAETAAFVVTEPGLSVIELGAEPAVSALVELTEDPIDNPASRDVNVTPDGTLALVRVEGSSELGVVDIGSGERKLLDLGGAITDLDLSSDGSRAYAVAGNELVVLPVPPEGVSPSRAGFGDEVLRSVSPSSDGAFAVLYSNAFPSSRVGAVAASADWAEVEQRVVDVKAIVSSALTSPDARHAIVLGDTPAGSSKAGAFALVPAQMDRVIKIVGTDAPPRLVSFAPNGEHAVLATRDDVAESYGAYLIELAGLAEEFVPLSSPPVSVGIVASKSRAFVAQLHPEGRITFVDLETHDAHTLTGFELAAKVSGQ